MESRALLSLSVFLCPAPLEWPGVQGLAALRCHGGNRRKTIHWLFLFLHHLRVTDDSLTIPAGKPLQKLLS